MENNATEMINLPRWKRVPFQTICLKGSEEER